MEFIPFFGIKKIPQLFSTFNDPLMERNEGILVNSSLIPHSLFQVTYIIFRFTFFGFNSSWFSWVRSYFLYNHCS